ncbi:MAG: DJ-1/PfpI family protein, partial [Thermodesulfobacteriota bacterium]
DPAMVRLAKEMAESGKVVAAICHGGLLLAAAGVLAGRTVTGFSAIRKELLEAGATFLDQEVVIDGNCITSRRPDDLPAFLRAIIKRLAG